MKFSKCISGTQLVIVPVCLLAFIVSCSSIPHKSVSIDNPDLFVPRLQPNEAYTDSTGSFEMVPQTDHYKSAAAFAMSNDGTILVSGTSYFDNIHLWNSDGTLLNRDISYPAPHCFNFSPDGERFVFGTRDARILEYDLHFNLLHDEAVQINDNRFKEKNWSAIGYVDNRTIIAINDSGWVFRIKDGVSTHIHTLPQMKQFTAAANPRAGLYAYAISGEGISIRDASKKKSLFSISSPDVLKMAFVPGKNSIIVQHTDGFLRL